jgi:hypothetical protein
MTQAINKIWGETHVEDTTHVEDKFKQVKYLFVYHEYLKLLACLGFMVSAHSQFEKTYPVEQ